MKSAKTLLIVFLALCCGKMTAADFTRDGNYVTIPVKAPVVSGAKMLRLQVVGEKIIRVQATNELSFKSKKSLIIVPQTANPRYQVTEKAGKVIVSTAAMKAIVEAKTGRIAFYSHDGKPLLSESKSGGKTIVPFKVPSREIGADSHLSEEQLQGVSWHALFDSPKDEAFYGLGQHQAEELNMKGKNEELYQYNTKVSIPFVISNKNYGILWDSYSFCRFGNPEDYMQLNRAFTLYNKEGKRGSLTGTYIEKDGKRLVRNEDSIYYEFALPELARKKAGTDVGVANLPTSFKLNGAHVTYEGYLEAPVENVYRFMLYYAGYMKVYLDGKEVVPERWRTAWNPNSNKFTFPMKKGHKAKLLIDWFPDGDVSYCGLRVASPRSEDEQNKLSIWSEMTPDMDYYVITGNTIDDIISGYRTLTGKANVYPKWALGYWQSRERYTNSNEIEATLSEFRRRNIPIDNIVQDWNYWRTDSWGDHTFDATRYPNPQQMLDSVHALHGRFMISVWPKFYCSVKNYKELERQGWIYQQAVQDSIYDWLGYMGSFYDAYSDGARKMFWRQMNDNLYQKYKFGIDAWWMDASEPNVRDCTPMWYRKALCGPTALGSSTEYFNAYSIVNADAIYNGQRSVNPNQRVFLLTRSGFAGEQRYSTATWSGDIATRWEDMRAQMTAGMNYSISGLPFWGMDQGGFCVENRYVKAQQLFDKTGEENADLKEWRELQTRWNQFGCFIPIYRSHGQWPLREVWNIAPDNHPAYQTIVAYDRLRYRMMPYLYSMAGAVHFNDYTMMRPLVMDFNGDARVYDIKDQWMFGPSFMACPVGTYQARTREVYLPKQRGWYNLYTNEYYTGGQTITADAPYEKIPVFVPEGAIIPFGPAMEWSDEKPAELITLYIYGGKNGQFTLYEDEGTNYNYERGKYATIPFSYDDKTQTLTIGKREGSFDGMLQSRRFKVVYRHPGVKVQDLDIDGVDGMTVNYSGNAMKIKLK